MKRTRLVGIAAAALAMLGGPLGAAPAHAWCVHWTCKTVEQVAEDMTAYVGQQVITVRGHIDDDVAAVVDAVGKTVVGAACDLFPSQPECS